MAQAKGALSKVLIDFETTFGEDPGSAAGIVMPFNYPFDLGGNRPLKEANNTNRGRRDAGMPFYGQFDVKGGATVPIDQIATGYWLRALLGAPVTTGPVGLIYTHVFTPGSSIESLVVEKEFTNITAYLKANGVKLNKMEVEFGGDGELVAKLDFIGGDETPGGAAYDASPTALVFSRFHNMQASIQEGGGAVTTIQSGKFAIKNNLDESCYVIDGSGGRRADVPEGECTIDGALKMMFSNLTFLNKGLNGTESSLVIAFTDGDNSLTFEFAEVLYEYKSPSILKGGIWVEPTFQAFLEDDAGDAAVTVTLVNTHASYA